MYGIWESVFGSVAFDGHHECCFPTSPSSSWYFHHCHLISIWDIVNMYDIWDSVNMYGIRESVNMYGIWESVNMYGIWDSVFGSVNFDGHNACCFRTSPSSRWYHHCHLFGIWDSVNMYGIRDSVFGSVTFDF